MGIWGAGEALASRIWMTVRYWLHLVGDLQADFGLGKQRQLKGDGPCGGECKTRMGGSKMVWSSSIGV